MMDVGHFSRLLRSTSMPRSPELALQDAIADALARKRISFRREVHLSSKDIIDFLVEDGLGLEVKIDGSLSEVTRQLHRYAQSDEVTSLLLVTTRSKHRSMPSSLNDKRIVVVHLIGGSF